MHTGGTKAVYNLQISSNIYKLHAYSQLYLNRFLYLLFEAKNDLPGNYRNSNNAKRLFPQCERFLTLFTI